MSKAADDCDGTESAIPTLGDFGGLEVMIALSMKREAAGRVLQLASLQMRERQEKCERMSRKLSDANSEESEVVTIDKEHALHKSQCQGGEEGGRGADERRAKRSRKS